MPDSRFTEVEVALLVCADEPEAVADAIAGLADIGGYALTPEPEQAIHDLYFDFDDGRLAAHGIALRVRNVNARTLLTVKGPGRRAGAGAHDRMEVEGDWSLRALSHALHIIAGFDVEVPELVETAGPRESHAALANLGLTVIQDRRTLRRPRRVARAKKPDANLAELAVDIVDYMFDRGGARLFEVEVETTHLAGSLVLSEISGALLRRWPRELRRWEYSKITTGLALAEAAENGSLAHILSADGTVKAEGCGELEQILGG